MTNLRTVKQSLFKKWLSSKGLVEKRSSGSHHIWDYPSNLPQLTRCITIRNKDKEIPLLHIKTTIKTLGVDLEQFLSEIEKL